MEILKILKLLLKNHRKVDLHKNIIRFYEISKDPTLGKYLMILKYANQEGIIHRDLHSNNVLVHDHTYHQNS
ncbi:kinase-like domain-containing protein [Rhizophagus irregularis DAOM 181602=DAOM 197198]|nr:kinase-like domain-containing protein [Rhizophagus irregularis DAOM 181602=DAOM 197198]